MANIREYNMNGTLILGIDHGYGNILCKGKYNPDIFQDTAQYKGNS